MKAYSPGAAKNKFLLSISQDTSFLKDTVPVEIGELPQVRDEVATYGFPEGGEELSITEGVASRVELQDYSHSSARLLSCQTDAAINPGSIGEPVIKENKILGVAFEAMEVGTV